MTCPTCNGAMTLPNPNGIGVEQCHDCKDGKIKPPRMKETTLAKIVFILCFLACLLWPREGGAQTVFHAITKEAAKHDGIISLPTGIVRIDSMTIATNETKKDTILVDVACKRQLSETIQNHSSGSALHLSIFNVLGLKTLRQERPLETKTGI